MTVDHPELVTRLGPQDERIVLDMLDAAVEWMTSQGLQAQWGTQPFSSSPKRVQQVRNWLIHDRCFLWGSRREPYAVLVLGDPPPHVSAARLPELYVVLLVSSRAPAARGAGRSLLDMAMALARDEGAHQVRVDCFAGNGGRLVDFYESCGFRRTEQFCVEVSDGRSPATPWRGQVLVREVRRTG